MRARRRRKPPGATTNGGWGYNHQRRRDAIAPIVNAGRATCCRCGEPIRPGDNWHLDHNSERTGYQGVSHAVCNLRHAASLTNGKRRYTAEPEGPYKWAQKWSDDPPIGTVVLGHEQVIYLGNGEWQPLDAGAASVGEGR